jgi:hypothetical protein
MSDTFWRFGHHPDPTIDFCTEVDSIQAAIADRAAGFDTPTDEEIDRRIFRAMAFRVGGDRSAVEAKDALREIANSRAPTPSGITGNKTEVTK